MDDDLLIVVGGQGQCFVGEAERPSLRMLQPRDPRGSGQVRNRGQSFGEGRATGGLTAIEHLRQVFSELDAHTVREFVSFPRYYLLFGEDGQLLAPAEPEAAAQLMLDRVHWWAEALVAARAVAV